MTEDGTLNSFSAHHRINCTNCIVMRVSKKSDHFITSLVIPRYSARIKQPPLNWAHLHSFQY
jgi:hypothetical protein